MRTMLVITLLILLVPAHHFSPLLSPRTDNNRQRQLSAPVRHSGRLSQQRDERQYRALQPKDASSHGPSLPSFSDALDSKGLSVSKVLIHAGNDVLPPNKAVSRMNEQPTTGMQLHSGECSHGFLRHSSGMQVSSPHSAGSLLTVLHGDETKRVKMHHLSQQNSLQADYENSVSSFRTTVSGNSQFWPNAEVQSTKENGKNAVGRSKRSYSYRDFRYPPDVQHLEGDENLPDTDNLNEMKHRLQTLNQVPLRHPVGHNAVYSRLSTLSGWIHGGTRKSTQNSFYKYRTDHSDSTVAALDSENNGDREQARIYNTLYRKLVDLMFPENSPDQRYNTNLHQQLTSEFVNQYPGVTDSVKHSADSSLASESSVLADNGALAMFLNGSSAEYDGSREPFTEVSVQLSMDDVAPSPRFRRNKFQLRELKTDPISVQRRRVGFSRGDLVRRLHQPRNLRPLRLFTSLERERQEKEKKEQQLYALLEQAQPLRRLESPEPYDCGSLGGPLVTRCPSDVNLCLMDVMLCDGIKDCPFGEDETTSFCKMQRWVHYGLKNA